MNCPKCDKPYERHPLIGVMTCFLHPSEEEQNWMKPVLELRLYTAKVEQVNGEVGTR